MKNTIICLWSHGRRPVQYPCPSGLVDRQDLPPAGWCSCCGAEIYRPDRSLCERCRLRGTERSIYELCESL